MFMTYDFTYGNLVPFLTHPSQPSSQPGSEFNPPVSPHPPHDLAARFSRGTFYFLILAGLETSSTVVGEEGITPFPHTTRYFISEAPGAAFHGGSQKERGRNSGTPAEQ